MALSFKNDDGVLLAEVERVMRERADFGLEGLVGGLECVVINTHPDRLEGAVNGLLQTTGLEFRQAFETESGTTCVLVQEGSADFLVTTRKNGINPFRDYNLGPKSEHVPDARLETFFYKCPRIDDYVRIQKGRGVQFMTEDVIDAGAYRFIQTKPSPYTGNSVGMIQWAEAEGDYTPDGARMLDLRFEKPDWPHLANIRELDHTATRVRAEERDKAIIEFMELTNYKFEFAIYVGFLNSITNVARLSADDYAQVFTSGIEPFMGLGESGPTETYIYNYGTRVHHMAFRTDHIEQTFAALAEHGMEFLVELVGSEEEGLRQTFSVASPDTLLVNEYIQRYGDFTGFFTKSNVTLLTKATEKQ